MDDAASGGRLLAGKYRLDARLGQGGMGAVWRAEHVQLRMPVAVKLMARDMLDSPTFRARFEREARAAAQLRSRHVVGIHDYGFEGDEPFMVMELLEGEDLAARLRREGRLAPAAAATVFAQIARALDRAHAADLVHRDLKPANVFIARADDEEIVKVVDFGIAKEAHAPGADGLTGEDEILGTPTYMSPEHIRGQGPIDRRADLWALAVIGYRMLTGRLPFSGDTGGDLVVRVCTEPAPPPSTLDRAFGPAIDRFFERALAKDPAARFGSAREQSAAFEAALGVSVAYRSSHGSLPMIDLPPVSAPVDTTLSAQATSTFTPRGHAAPPRRPRVAIIVGAGVLACGLVVAIGLGLHGAGADPASGAIATASAATAVTSASAAPTASTSASATPSEDTAPSADATSSAAPVATAPVHVPGPLRPKPAGGKRRKVELGL